jgi:hypothetical protein
MLRPLARVRDSFMLRNQHVDSNPAQPRFHDLTAVLYLMRDDAIMNL